MGFIHYIYKYTPTYRVTLPSYPTCETKVQISMALLQHCIDYTSQAIVGKI